MAISEKTRKILWAKSANRCSICKTELFSKKDDSKEFNIGEECHIISSKINGPRYKPNIIDYDENDNLILLCRNHHREIDLLTEKYSEESLINLKIKHEKWVQNTINKEISSKKINDPKFLLRITTGKELLNIISECHGYETDYDELDNEEEAEYIGGILQIIIDFGEISSDIQINDKVKIGYEFDGILKELETKGYFLFGEKRIETINYNNSVIDDWTIATLIIRKKDNTEIIKVDYNESTNNKVN